MHIELNQPLKRTATPSVFAVANCHMTVHLHMYVLILFSCQLRRVTKVVL